MASEMLLINPRRRRRAASTTKRRRRSRRSNPAPAIRRASPVRARRANPLARRRRRVARRSNPVAIRRTRRRNPISLGNANMYITALKQAAIGAGGAIGIDLLMGYIAPKLPASLQKQAGKVGAYEVVKAIGTIAIGFLLAKPSRGLSLKAAQGALTVQITDMAKTMVPSSMTMGYANPAWVTDASARIGPNRINRYAAPGSPTPLLNRYTQQGSPMLNRGPSMREREGAVY